MSYLVLALGAFLSLCGAWAVYAGYGIIQVERGWASVIAGSMAFSCGIVTLALGFILHKLSRIHAFLESGKSTALPAHELSPWTASEPSREHSLSFSPETSIVPETVASKAAAAPPTAATPRTWPQRPMRSNLTAARNFLKSRGSMLLTARGSHETESFPRKGAPLSRESVKTTQTAPEPTPESEFDLSTEAAEGKVETRPPFTPDEAAAAEFAWRADSEPGLFDEVTAADKMEEPPFERLLPEMRYTPGEPEAQSEPNIAWPAETASINTAFERELLVEIDQALESRDESAEPAPEVIGAASPDFGPSEGSEIINAADPPSPEPPPPLPSAAQEELAIVGHYESGGTSYVMYSDGSIEARTEHAVFHFKSMAELKAFMASDARTSQE